ncbi:hypothetical protein WJX72_001501 [[Myrmecia] bisecta]|uniref:Thioredoxin domain-containing protein n=1 Tax=[Myrmecia] bisecta TaxID=41462 RepID=A0AAW1QPW4_9CHLO
MASSQLLSRNSTNAATVPRCSFRRSYACSFVKVPCSRSQTRTRPTTCFSQRAQIWGHALGRPVPGVRTLAAAAAVSSGEQAAEKSLRELTIDDFDECIKEAPGLVVVDFFTDWCGPCKIMMPLLVAMQDEMPDVLFTKLNCNKKNKELGVRLNIKVAPTFQLYKNGVKVADMTGAKIEELRKLIEAHRSVRQLASSA